MRLLFFSTHHLTPLTLYSPTLKRFSASLSTNRLKWNSTANVIITNPILLILESCTNMRQLKQIQAHMTCIGLVTHTFPLSRVLAFCAVSDAGDIRHAHVLFTQIEKPNTYMWNTMIRGYCRAQNHFLGFSFFRHMVRQNLEIDSRSFIFALKACGRFLRELEGNLVHCLVWKMGFDSDLLVRNGLVHFYAERGSLGYARQVFDGSSARDVFTWTSMIDGYARHSCFADAMKLFDLMLLSNVEPNEVTMTAVITVCSQQGNLDIGKRIQEYITRKNLSYSLNLQNAILNMYVKCGSLVDAREIFENMKNKDVYSWTSLLNGYAKSGDLESAREFFDIMPERNVVSWNAMIAGYSQNNKPKEALKLFHEMVDSGLNPIENTLVCVLSACGQLGCLDLGQWIHHYYIKGKHIQPSVILVNSIIDMYAKCGDIGAARELFSGMTKKDKVSYNSMISGYAVHGHAKEALILFEQMKVAGLKPDDITFVGILSACSHSGLILEGREYFKSMETSYGIDPKGEHYACMIDLLGRIGLLEESYDLITRMPFGPSAAAWGALLNACRVHGNVELAKLTSKKLLELDPEDSGIYVLLANTCAKGRRWSDVGMARQMMRERGVKKIPGHSVVEVEGVLNEFLVADDSHPRSEEIYKVINELFLLSKPIDYEYVSNCSYSFEAACILR